MGTIWGLYGDYMGTMVWTNLNSSVQHFIAAPLDLELSRTVPPLDWQYIWANPLSLAGRKKHSLPSHRSWVVPRLNFKISQSSKLQQFHIFHNFSTSGLLLCFRTFHTFHTWLTSLRSWGSSNRNGTASMWKPPTSLQCRLGTYAVMQFVKANEHKISWMQHRSK